MSLKYFKTLKNEIQIQGHTISDWAQINGKTPFFIYDREIILKKIAAVRNTLPEGIDLHFAVKANPMPELVRFMAQHVNGFDIASTGEMKVALAAGMSPVHIGFAGPGKTDEELHLALTAGVLISVESINELQRISKISQKEKLKPRVALRINPEFEMKSSGMKMGGGPKPFGIDSEKIPEVCQILANLKIPLEGIHVFTGSQTLNADILCDTQSKCFDLLLSLKKYFHTPLQSFNFGGGFGIPYFNGDQDLELDKIKNNLKPLMQKFRQEFPQTRAILELGRFLVGECGLYISRIVDKKVSRGVTFLVLDGGMNNHLAASGNLGQTIKRSFPIQIANKLETPTKELVNIVGPLCTPLDHFATQLEVSTCEVGDLVAIFLSGAYGLSSSPIHFLSHEVPKEIFA